MKLGGLSFIIPLRSPSPLVPATKHPNLVPDLLVTIQYFLGETKNTFIRLKFRIIYDTAIKLLLCLTQP